MYDNKGLYLVRMAHNRYDKWTVHSWTSPDDESPGAEVHDGDDGTTYRVTVRDNPDDPEGRPVVNSLTIHSDAPEGIDRTALRSVPLALLRDFALNQVREQRAAGSDALLVDLTHHGTDDGHTERPAAQRNDLEAFAAFFGPLPRRVVTRDGRTVARRDYVVTEWESPYCGLSYSWLDKITRRARDEGLIPEHNPQTPGGKSSPGSTNRK